MIRNLCNRIPLTSPVTITNISSDYHRNIDVSLGFFTRFGFNSVSIRLIRKVPINTYSKKIVPASCLTLRSEPRLIIRLSKNSRRWLSVRFYDVRAFSKKVTHIFFLESDWPFLLYSCFLHFQADVLSRLFSSDLYHFLNNQILYFWFA